MQKPIHKNSVQADVYNLLIVLVYKKPLNLYDNTGLSGLFCI